MEKLTVVQEKALEITGLSERKRSPKGWMYGRCPFCDHPSKFGLKFNHQRTVYKNHLSFNCFRGSCRRKGTEWELFKHFNLTYLLGQKESISEDTKLKSDLLTLPSNNTKLQEESKTVPIPIGWRRVMDNEYLRDRGWEDWQFENYVVGVSELMYQLRDYVILLILEKGENKGYVARSTKSPDWIEEWNSRAKEYNKGRKDERDKMRFHPKYYNEGGVNFDELLFGIDEIVSGVDTVIIVEGPFDKTNTDKQLQLHKSSKVKCVCTFGKKISYIQMAKLRDRGIKNILLLYDPDAIETSKEISFQLEKEFNVKISVHKTKDPGEMVESDFLDVISNARSTIHFYSGVVHSNL